MLRPALRGISRCRSFSTRFTSRCAVTPAPARNPVSNSEPAPVADPVWQGQLGAIGEHLADRWFLTKPRWTNHPSRFLATPHFPSGTERYKGWYFVQSPIAFRRRMIFTEAEPLRRARFPRAEFYERDLARGNVWTANAVQAVFGETGPPAVQGVMPGPATNVSAAPVSAVRGQ